MQERAFCPFLHNPKSVKTEVNYAEKSYHFVLIAFSCLFSCFLRKQGRDTNKAQHSRDFPRR